MNYGIKSLPWPISQLDRAIHEYERLWTRRDALHTAKPGLLHYHGGRKVKISKMDSSKPQVISNYASGASGAFGKTLAIVPLLS